VTAPPIRLPSGVRDFLPRAAARRRALAGRVMDVFEAWGYARIITPVFECADVLERGLGDAARTAAIRFVEPGTGEIVALRPDITPQIARVVATRLAEVEGPIRLCYEGAVTRLAGEPAGDAEVLAVAAAVLTATQLPETRLDVGHVACARHVLDAAPDREARDRIVAALVRKDRKGLAAAARVLPSEVAPLAEALVGLWGPAAPTLTRALALPWPAQVRAALEGLASALAAFAELADPPAPAVTVDLGDVRGEGYYTGIRFAGYAGGAPEAVLRGGRYDELIERYGRAARATGFAVDLEALAQAQRAVGVAGPTSTVGVAVFGPGAAALARALRGHGLRAVTAATAPTATWLRGAGFEAALLLDRNQLVRADGAQRGLDILDPRALVKLLEEDRCPS